MMVFFVWILKNIRHRLKNHVSYDSYDPYDSSENQALVTFSNKRLMAG